MRAFRTGQQSRAGGSHSAADRSHPRAGRHTLLTLTFLVAALLAAGGALAAPRVAQGVAADEAGTISGAVTKADNSGIAGVQVTVYAEAAGGRQVVASTLTSASGVYTVTAPAGTCWVGFADPRYVAEFYDNKPTLSTADAVTVIAGQKSANINARLAALGSLSGKVTGPNAKAINGIQVTAYIYDGFGHWQPASTATTSGGGLYTLAGLPPGAYRVGFVDPTGKYLSEFFDNKFAVDKASDITVYAGAPTPNVNAQLALPASIQGNVTNSAGAGVSGIAIRVFLNDGAGHWYAVGGTTTEGSGGYLVENLPAGHLRVQFSDPADHYLTQFYNSAATLAGAKDVAATAGQSSSGISARLVVASRIAGRVTKPSGTGLPGVKVVAQRKTGSGWQTAGTATTDAKGAYVVDGLPSGTYRVEFIEPTGAYVDEFYKGQLMPDRAAAVTLVTGALRKAVNAQLAIAGRIGGVVRGTGDHGLAQMQVTAFRQEGTRWVLAGSATSGPGGDYRIAGLAKDTYRVRFSDPTGAYVTAYYRSAQTIEIATSVTVRAGFTTSGISLRLVLKK